VRLQDGRLTVAAHYQLNGVPLADADIPFVTVDGLSMAPNPPATIDPTSWGPATASPLLSHDVALVADPARWQLSGLPNLAGEGCAWTTEPSPAASEVHVTVPPAGDCTLTFSLERLVATVVVHHLYLNAPGDPSEVSVSVDGVTDSSPWQTAGSLVDRREKTVAVLGAGSALEVTSATPAGWAPVATFEGDCGAFEGPASPLAGTAETAAFSLVGPGDTVEVCFVSVAVGSVVLIMNETHGTEAPESWSFITTSPDLGTPVLTTAPNPLPAAAPVSALESVVLVPVGDYGIIQADGRTACLPGTTAADFETRAAALAGSPPSDAETSEVIGPGALPFSVLKGQTTYIRFDNVGCGTVLETGVISIEVVNDLDGNGSHDPGETGIPCWPLEISGPDGSASMLTDASGMAYYTVVTGGAYVVRQGAIPGWLATAPIEAPLAAGLGLTVPISFFNQPRVSSRHRCPKYRRAAPAERQARDGRSPSLAVARRAPSSATPRVRQPSLTCRHPPAASTRSMWPNVPVGRSSTPRRRPARWAPARWPNCRSSA